MLPSLTACNDVALEGLASMLRPRLPAWPISQNRDEAHVVCSRLVEAGKEAIARALMLVLTLRQANFKRRAPCCTVALCSTSPGVA